MDEETLAAKAGSMSLKEAPKVPSVEDMPKEIELLTSESDAAVLKAVTSLRKMLSVEKAPPIQMAIDGGAVGPLLELAKRDDASRIQFEALWALTNIASGTSEHTQAVIDAGGVDVAVTCLSVPNADVQEQAVWMLGNIAGDTTAARDLVIGAGMVQGIQNTLVPTSRLSLMRNSVWAASNLCRGKPQPPLAALAPLVPLLARMLQVPDVEVQTDAAWALSYLSDGTNDRIQAVIDSGAVPTLVPLLLSESANVVMPSLRCVGNLVTGDDAQTQLVLDAGALQPLRTCLQNPRAATRKEACWALSNITAGSRAQIQAVIDSGAVPLLTSLLSRDEAPVKKEALWAIANLTSGGSSMQVAYAVETGILAPVSAMLASDVDSRLNMVALEAIENVLRNGAAMGPDNRYLPLLEDCGAVDLLEKLQTSEDAGVYDKVSRILQQYFEFEDDDDEVAVHPAQAPAAPQGQAPQGAFGAPQFSFPDEGSDEDDDLMG